MLTAHDILQQECVSAFLSKYPLDRMGWTIPLDVKKAFTANQALNIGFLEKQKRLGYRKGTPDLLLYIAKTKKVIFVELKTKRDTLKKNQKIFKEMIELVWQNPNLIFKEIRSVEEFKILLQEQG